MYPPLPNSLPHVLGRFVADGWGEVDEEFSISVLRTPRLKGVAQKIKGCFGMVSCAVIIFTVDDSCFVGMQFKTTFFKALF